MNTLKQIHAETFRIRQNQLYNCMSDQQASEALKPLYEAMMAIKRRNKQCLS